MFERTKKVSIGEKTFMVKFPNVGQLIDVECMKQALSNNRYGAMAQSGVISMYYALDIIDAVSFISICVPEIAKYYDVNSYTSLPPEQIAKFVSLYKEQIKPWFDGIMAELKGVTDEDETKEKSEE